jgi:TRAP-type transport system periplasmic protein
MPLLDSVGRPCRYGARRPRRLPRRSLLAAAAAGLTAPSLPRFAGAVGVTWRLGHIAPSDFPLHQRLLEVAAAINIHSAGQMKLEVYANSERGGAAGLFAQLRAGTIDVVPLTCQQLASDLALGALPMVGFAFADYNAAWAALDGDVGAYIRAQMKERLGLVTMNRCWNYWFRQFTTGGTVIKEAPDVEGLRVRTPPEADFVGLLQALKILPISVPLSGLETALKSRVIDGQEGLIPLIKAARLYEAQSTCALTYHIWDGHWISISGKSWQTLPPTLREIVAAAFDDGATHQRQDSTSAEEQIRKDLESGGMAFNAVDANSFRHALRKAGYYQAWRSKVGEEAWSVLEKYSGRLT